MFTDLNFWAILVSGAVFWVLGGIWYAAIFTKPWQEALGFNALDEAGKAKLQKDFPKALLAHFVSGLLTSFVMAHLTRMDNSLVGGMLTGFWTWLGFAFTIHPLLLNAHNVLFTKNLGNYLLATKI